MRVAWLVAVTILWLAGCVTVGNEKGLCPPNGLCSHVRSTMGVPKCPIDCANLKTGRTDKSFHVQEWVFSGASADVIDMMLAKAAANGRLKRVAYADYEMTSILGFVTLFNLVAYGE